MKLTPKEVELVKNILTVIQSETDDVDSWGRVKVPFNFSPLERHDINALCAKLNKPAEPEVNVGCFNFTTWNSEAAEKALRIKLSQAKNSEVLSRPLGQNSVKLTNEVGKNSEAFTK